MITKCEHCGKPIAVNRTAWAAKGFMFCSEECGLAENDEDWDLVAEEVSREDYGADTVVYSSYDDIYDISTYFETVYEGGKPVVTKLLGFHYGKPSDSSEKFDQIIFWR